MEKVCTIVKKQLALPDDSNVSGESKFAALGADSLDTVTVILSDILQLLLYNASWIYLPKSECKLISMTIVLNFIYMQCPSGWDCDGARGGIWHQRRRG